MRHRRVLPSVVSFLLLVLMVATGSLQAGAGGRPPKSDAYRASLDKMNARLRTTADRAGPATGARLVPITDNFTVIGHTDLGASDTNGDVWVHGNFAYVGTWADPCNGLGVKIVDVSNPASPVMIGRVGGIAGTSAEDVVVRSVSTASFTGDLLATGIQRCGGDPALDDDEFGVDFWNVTNPVAPVHLSFLGLTTGFSGVHELDLFQRGPNVYALLATPSSEWFDPQPGGEFWIADVTNPASPTIVGEWGAGAEGFSPGPFYGQGSFGSMFDHSARASADGTKAYVSYWDLGVLTLDISDITNPTLLSRTMYPADADGDAHSVAVYQGTSTTFLLQNDEDFDPRSPARIVSGGTVGVGSEAPYARPLWRSQDHRLTGRVVRPAREGLLARRLRIGQCPRPDRRGEDVLQVLRPAVPSAGLSSGEAGEGGPGARRGGGRPRLHRQEHQPPVVLVPRGHQGPRPVHRPRHGPRHGRRRPGQAGGQAALVGVPPGVRREHRSAGGEVRRPPVRAHAELTPGRLEHPQQRGHG